MSFRFEVWDPPGIATFERKIASLPTISASGTVYRRQTGRGSATIPGDYPRLDDVITVDPSNHANDVASTIRVYRYDDWCQDLVVKSSPNLVAGQDATLTLDGIETVLDWAVVEAWDWDGTADFVSEFPDWVYGGRNLLVDPSLSESVCEPRISEFWTDATSGQWRVNVDGDTVDIDYNATASQVTTAYESLSTVTDVRVEGNGSADTPWRVTFVEPCFPATTYTVTTNTLNAPINAALIQLGSEQAPGWTEAQPLFGNTLYGVYDEFEVATLPSATPAGTTEGLKFDGQAPVGFSFPGAQTVPAVTPGALVQGGVWVYVDAAGSYPMRLVLRTPSEEPLIASSTFPSTSVTGQTWTLLSFADATIPDWIDRAIFRVSYVGTANPPDIYVADAYLREGMAENTVGFIMGELLDDAQTDHAADPFPRATITFINKTFTDSLDSAGNAWDSDVFVSIPRGMTYRKVLERIFGQLGYEWSVTPTSGTPGEWDLNIWNPDGRGTDYSAADTPSILFGQGTLSGSATRTLPPGNIVISEGAGFYTSRAANSASYGTIGRREWWQTDISYQQTQVDDWTDRQLARFLDETLNPRFEIADPPAGSDRPVPLIDFGLADTMNVDLATGGGKVSRQVEAISWRTVDDGIMFGVQLGDTQFDNIGGLSGGGSGGSVDMAAMGPVNEGVRRLIDAFKRPQFQPAASAFVPSGGGGAPTIVVAASDASDISKRKADYVCNGSSDTATLQTAIAALPTSPRQMGRLLLTEGTFYIYESGAADVFEVGSNVHIQGMGRLTTRISVAANATTTNRVLFDLRDGSLLSDLTIEKNASLTLTSNSYTAVGLFGVRCGLRDVDILEVGALGGSSETSVWSGNSQPYQFIDNCYIEAPKRALYAVTASEFHLTDSYLSSDDGEVVYLSGVERFFMRGNTVVGVATDTNILMVGTCRDWWIVDNDIQAGLNGIYLDNSASGTSGRGFILGNHFSNFIEECGVFLNLPNSGPAYVVIADNLIQSVGQGVSFGNAAGAIRCIGDDIDPLTDKNNDQEPGLIVAHNRLEGLGLGYGIKLEAIEGALVQGNHVEDPGNHAIYVSGGGWNRILDNLALWPRSSDAFDGVYVDADECYVSRNQVVDHSGAGPSYFRYGINVAGGYCNIVVGNDLVATGGGTDYLIDSGTSTILSYPGDMTYGDNFTDCGAS